MKRALISGITGQDGSYLAEHLLEAGYEVHGLVRRVSSFNYSRIEHLRNRPDLHRRLVLHPADLTDSTTLRRVFVKVAPDEYYHLAGQSHVGLSFEIPESTCEETGMAVVSMLEICRDLARPPRIFHPASSEVFGVPGTGPTQDENTPFRPSTPYGCAKAFAANLCRVYRESYGLFVSNGIMFNHESPRRAENFVTKKIATTVARIAAGSDEVLELGNLDTSRDWGYAPEFVKAMNRILLHDHADDFVLGTGQSTTVREFVIASFQEAGMPIAFEGTGINERARDLRTGRTVLAVNSRFFRKGEPGCLVANCSHARKTIQWNPEIHGQALARLMVRAELGFDDTMLSPVASDAPLSQPIAPAARQGSVTSHLPLTMPLWQGSGTPVQSSVDTPSLE